MKPKVLVDPHGYALPEDLARLGQVVEVIKPTECLSESAFIEALAGCEGVIRLGGRLPELTRAVFAGASDLRIVGVSGDRFGTGIDLAAAQECGVLAVDTDNIASAAPVAEWDLALMLLCLRNGAAVYRQMMAGEEAVGAGRQRRFCPRRIDRQEGRVGRLRARGAAVGRIAWSLSGGSARRRSVFVRGSGR